MKIPTIAVLAFAIFAASCATPPLKLYSGPKQPDDQIAILKWGGFRMNSFPNTIDGKEIEGTSLNVNAQARLLPGKHTIVYSRYFRKLGRRCGTATIDLKAGHVYRLKAARSMLWHFYSRATVWIEDEATGEVLHGSRTPHAGGGYC